MTQWGSSSELSLWGRISEKPGFDSTSDDSPWASTQSERGCSNAQSEINNQLRVWFSGMILALGARGCIAEDKCVVMTDIVLEDRVQLRPWCVHSLDSVQLRSWFVHLYSQGLCSALILVHSSSFPRKGQA
nr:hypothetical protein Iba_chr11bCG11550 [Ipomoea batatas]